MPQRRTPQDQVALYEAARQWARAALQACSRTTARATRPSTPARPRKGAPMGMLSGGTMVGACTGINLMLYGKNFVLSNTKLSNTNTRHQHLGPAPTPSTRAWRSPPAHV
jgi:hypothetical protein